MNSLAELYQTVLLCVSYAENVFLRRMQDVHSINKPLRRGKGALFVGLRCAYGLANSILLTITSVQAPKLMSKEKFQCVV